jgi:hypothetical protein
LRLGQYEIAFAETETNRDDAGGRVYTSLDSLLAE